MTRLFGDVIVTDMSQLIHALLVLVAISLLS